MLGDIKKYVNKDVEIEYMLTGIGNQSTILFIHGVGTSLRQFINQHAFFSKDYQVLSISLRGHGYSKVNNHYSNDFFSIRNHVSDIIAILDDLKINDVHYVGNSAGGIIGYELYKIRPEILKSLITFGTTAELKLSNFLVNMIVFIDKLMLKLNPKGYLKFISKNSSKINPVQKMIYDDLMLCDKKAIPLFRKNIGNYSYLDVVKAISIPLLIVQGEYDQDINKNLKSTIINIKENPNGTIERVSKAGHFTNLDQPNKFNEIVNQFLNNHKKNKV